MRRCQLGAIDMPLEIETSEKHADGGGPHLVILPVKHHIGLLEVGDVSGGH